MVISVLRNDNFLRDKFRVVECFYRRAASRHGVRGGRLRIRRQCRVCTSSPICPRFCKVVSKWLVSLKYCLYLGRKTFKTHKHE